MFRRQKRVLPGFRLTMGLTLVYLSFLVLIPFAGLILTVGGMSWEEYWAGVTSPRVLAAFRLTFGASFCAAMINAVFGFIVAWVLVRYRFPFRRLVDAMVDLPFAMPTAVSGVALLALFKRLGNALDVKIIFTEWGLLLALTFIGLPFVVRTLQPAIEDVEKELEEVSASLGANRWQTFCRVIFPSLRPALFTGFAMAFARALGEYGSVVFIAGTAMPIVSIEIAKNLQGNEEDMMIAVAIATTMLVASFLILFCINFIQFWMNRRYMETN
ncbi:MAG: sulfate ABC transporter permease subunit CysT [Thermoguttaceae bacterium]|nr:sulfate ABC transporter permease subunit CysT [Thermoguttaceae bacterium]MBP3695144.1 sulfate ABC transporter permease subunit CysT [Thermoguttaceae bacterium]